MGFQKYGLGGVQLYCATQSQVRRLRLSAVKRGKRARAVFAGHMHVLSTRSRLRLVTILARAHQNALEVQNAFVFP